MKGIWLISFVELFQWSLSSINSGEINMNERIIENQMVLSIKTQKKFNQWFYPANPQLNDISSYNTESIGEFGVLFDGTELAATPKETSQLWKTELDITTSSCLNPAAYQASFENHSPQIGWAADGFPIYGPIGLFGEMNSCSLKSQEKDLNNIDDNDHNNTHCLDHCGGMEETNPKIDDFPYRYYLSNKFLECVKYFQINNRGSSKIDDKLFSTCLNSIKFCHKGCCPQGVSCLPTLKTCTSSGSTSGTLSIQSQERSCSKNSHLRHLQERPLSDEDTPTGNPTSLPSSFISFPPSSLPTFLLTSLPSTLPSSLPSSLPTSPTSLPSSVPTSLPSYLPSSLPTTLPSSFPTSLPTSLPSSSCPTSLPTTIPSSEPSSLPTSLPSSSSPTSLPTSLPSAVPTSNPTGIPTSPTSNPTSQPSNYPSSHPSENPTSLPTSLPTGIPTDIPTSLPSVSPYPSHLPTISPEPTGIPTSLPTSSIPTTQPTSFPSSYPSSNPTGTPTGSPSSSPTPLPTSHPTIIYKLDCSDQDCHSEIQTFVLYYLPLIFAFLFVIALILKFGTNIKQIKTLNSNFKFPSRVNLPERIGFGRGLGGLGGGGVGGSRGGGGGGAYLDMDDEEDQHHAEELNNLDFLSTTAGAGLGAGTGSGIGTGSKGNDKNKKKNLDDPFNFGLRGESKAYTPLFSPEKKRSSISISTQDRPGGGGGGGGGGGAADNCSLQTSRYPNPPPPPTISTSSTSAEDEFADFADFVTVGFDT